MENFRISLAAARVNAGLTQAEVAKILHISPNTLVAWEKGKSEPSISQGRVLGELYNMPLDSLIFLPSISIKFDKTGDSNTWE